MPISLQHYYNEKVLPEGKKNKYVYYFNINRLNW